MAYAIPLSAGWLELVSGTPFRTEDGTQYPDNWLDHASGDDIAAIGGTDIAEPPDAPDGKVNRLTGLADQAGVPTRSYEVEDAPAPLAPPVPDTISDRQFFQALALQGMISNDEALAAVKTGEIPSAMAAFIATMPADQQFTAQMLLAGATIFERSNALVPAFMAAQTPPMTSADIDALWSFAAGL